MKNLIYFLFFVYSLGEKCDEKNRQKRQTGTKNSVYFINDFILLLIWNIDSSELIREATRMESGLVIPPGILK